MGSTPPFSGPSTPNEAPRHFSGRILWGYLEHEPFLTSAKYGLVGSSRPHGSEINQERKNETRPPKITARAKVAQEKKKRTMRVSDATRQTNEGMGRIKQEEGDGKRWSCSTAVILPSEYPPAPDGQRSVFLRKGHAKHSPPGSPQNMGSMQQNPSFCLLYPRTSHFILNKISAFTRRAIFHK